MDRKQWLVVKANKYINIFKEQENKECSFLIILFCFVLIVKRSNRGC